MFLTFQLFGTFGYQLEMYPGLNSTHFQKALFKIAIYHKNKLDSIENT